MKRVLELTKDLTYDSVESLKIVDLDEYYISKSPSIDLKGWNNLKTFHNSTLK
jgi:hypothetical protein